MFSLRQTLYTRFGKKKTLVSRQRRASSQADERDCHQRMDSAVRSNSSSGMSPMT